MIELSGFVELDKARHNRKTFDCGEPELNEFLSRHAFRHMEASISKSMVLPEDARDESDMQRICAFYTVSITEIDPTVLPKKQRKRLPPRSVPVYILAELAVNLEYKGQGLGGITLYAALNQIYHAHLNMPGLAVVVDCLNDEAERFYKHYGFVDLCEEAGRKRLILPMGTVEELCRPSI